jgi:tripartite-type tricarboxylate transporter receptor subunit TctC
MQVSPFTDQGNLIRQCKLHAIAVLGESRAREFPELRTMRDLDYDHVFTGGAGLHPPAGTLTGVFNRTDAACLRMMATPAVVDGLKRRGMPIEARRRADLDRALVHPCPRCGAEMIVASGRSDIPSLSDRHEASQRGRPVTVVRTRPDASGRNSA